MASFPRPFMSQWKLDKHVPIGVLVALACQTGLIVWYGGKLDNRVEVLEKAVSSSSADHDLLIRIDERLKVLAERLDQKLDAPPSP